jgi:heptosyltransferase I
MNRILILKLGAIGDVIHSLPVLSTLRSHLPRAHIAWAVEEPAAPVLEGNDALNEIILLQRKRLSGAGALPYIGRWVSNLRGKSFDVVLDLHNLFKTGLIARASGASLRIGFRKFREGNFLFMNRWVKPAPHYKHAVDKYLSLLMALGIEEPHWKRTFPLRWGAADEEAVRRFLAEADVNDGETLVAVNPGARWPSKRWPPERFAAVADEIAKRYTARMVILWGPGEKPLAESVAHRMSARSLIPPDCTLKQLMALINRCHLMISGDTGPVHLAASLGKPTVVLFGPSDPERNGPYGPGHEIVRSPVSPASHWMTKEHGRHWMDGITVEEVVAAAVRKLERMPSGLGAGRG